MIDSRVLIPLQRRLGLLRLCQFLLVHGPLVRRGGGPRRYALFQFLQQYSASVDQGVPQLGGLVPAKVFEPELLLSREGLESLVRSPQEGRVGIVAPRGRHSRLRRRLSNLRLRNIRLCHRVAVGESHGGSLLCLRLNLGLRHRIAVRKSHARVCFPHGTAARGGRGRRELLPHRTRRLRPGLVQSTLCEDAVDGIDGHEESVPDIGQGRFAGGAVLRHGPLDAREGSLEGEGGGDGDNLLLRGCRDGDLLGDRGIHPRFLPQHARRLLQRPLESIRLGSLQYSLPESGPAPMLEEQSHESAEGADL
mmetsp:Transcript_54591/g.163128  ORF Transcript_54591/g.163128 Transcript_54591/m.163128 type:complete len:307 (+) Transcript_54591:262-1182(+)